MLDTGLVRSLVEAGAGVNCQNMLGHDECLYITECFIEMYMSALVQGDFKQKVEIES